MEPFDISRPNVARMYDYYLGGTNNYAVDRAVAKQMYELMPYIPAAAQANRAYLKNAVTSVATAGVKQFIDFGSGLPTVENTHEIAQRVDREIKVMYVDRDPTAIAHAKAILAESEQEHAVRALAGDLREASVLAGLMDGFINWNKPVCLMFVAVMHFVGTPGCYRVIDEYKDLMAPGSYLVLSHSTDDFLSVEQGQKIEDKYAESDARIFLRSKGEITRFFAGLKLPEPGVIDVATWRAGDNATKTPMIYGGVGRKAAS
jgi:O-methyltransferase involved in polyketide biosynthesis